MAITDEKYVLLTTFRKNGDGVATPVWIVSLPDGTAGFTTEVDSGKVKRIRNNPSVTLQPCNLRGKVTADAEVVTATADVLLGADARPVTKAVRRSSSRDLAARCRLAVSKVASPPRSPRVRHPPSLRLIGY